MARKTSEEMKTLISDFVTQPDDRNAKLANEQDVTERRPGFRFYYGALTKPSRDGEGIVSVLRALMDGIPLPPAGFRAPERPR